MIPYALPFRHPYVTARGTLERREMALLRIRFPDGQIGLGEGVPMSLRGGDPLATVVGELRAWGERAEAGDCSVQGLSPPARVAARTALADAEARRSGLPLHELLRPGSGPGTLDCNATLTAGEPADVLRQAEIWAADGFRVFKLKLGTGDDVAQVEAVRQGLGDGVRLRVDANGSWSPREAAERLRALEPFGIELAEQPVADLAGMRELRELSSIPLVADESVANSEQAAEAARVGACDAVTVKLSKVGTLDASLGGHLPAYLSSALDGPVGIAAAAHAARALPGTSVWPGVAHGLATERLFASTISASESLLDGPRLTVPEDPGLGVEIDERSLEAHRL